MNTKTIGIGIAVLVVLAGIIGGTAIYNEKKQATVKNDTAVVAPAPAPEPAPAPVAPATESKSFKEILSTGGNVQCTFSDTADASTETNGSIISNGSMMRGNFQTQTDGKSMTGHMIMRDGYMYSWFDASQDGVKIKLDADKKSDTTGSNNVDADRKMNITCTPWSEDASQFILPSDRQFQDLSSFINDGIKADTSGSVKTEGSTNASQCAVCDNLTGTQKTQCLNALGCK